MAWPHYRNKNVFSDRRNRLYGKSASLRCGGKLFHSPGPAAARALSPDVLWVRVTTHIRVSANVRLYCNGVCVRACVCLSVRLSLCVIIFRVQNVSNSNERILMKFCGDVGRGPRTSRLDFEGYPVRIQKFFVYPD